MSESPEVLIVGGGSAGLFCALGLADRARVTIVEGGPDPGTPPPASVPHAHQFGAAMDWGYSEADRAVGLMRGRVLGGSSTTNASAAVRGQPASFDAWGDGLDLGRLPPRAARGRDRRAVRRRRLPRLGWADPDHAPLLRPDRRGLRVGLRQGGSRPRARPQRPRRVRHRPVADQPHRGRRPHRHSGGRHAPPARPGRRRRPTSRGAPRDRRAPRHGGGAARTGRAPSASRVPTTWCSAPAPTGRPSCCCAPARAAAELEAEGIAAVIDLPGVGRNLQDHPWVDARRCSPCDPARARGRARSAAPLLRYRHRRRRRTTRARSSPSPTSALRQRRRRPAPRISDGRLGLMAPRSRRPPRTWIRGGRTDRSACAT